MMRRDSLVIGERYVGPHGVCYEIVDLSPGWCIDASGNWSEDVSKRSRYVPGQGVRAYRGNHLLRVYEISESGGRKPAVVDSRKLVSPWEEFRAKRQAQRDGQIRAERILALLRRNLREYPGRTPIPADAYGVSEDGSSVTLPTQELLTLMDLAFGFRD